jgi:hypothetical protein
MFFNTIVKNVKLKAEVVRRPVEEDFLFQQNENANKEKLVFCLVFSFFIAIMLLVMYCILQWGNLFIDNKIILEAYIYFWWMIPLLIIAFFLVLTGLFFNY